MKLYWYGAALLASLMTTAAGCNEEAIMTDGHPVEGIVTAVRTVGVDEDNQPINVYIKVENDGTEYYCWKMQARECEDVELGDSVEMWIVHYEWAGSVHDNYVQGIDIN